MTEIFPVGSGFADDGEFLYFCGTFALPQVFYIL